MNLQFSNSSPFQISPFALCSSFQQTVFTLLFLCSHHYSDSICQTSSTFWTCTYMHLEASLLCICAWLELIIISSLRHSRSDLSRNIPLISAVLYLQGKCLRQEAMNDSSSCWNKAVPGLWPVLLRLWATWRDRNTSAAAFCPTEPWRHWWSLWSLQTHKSWSKQLCVWQCWLVTGQSVRVGQRFVWENCWRLRKLLNCLFFFFLLTPFLWSLNLLEAFPHLSIYWTLTTRRFRKWLA